MGAPLRCPRPINSAADKWAVAAGRAVRRRQADADVMVMAVHDALCARVTDDEAVSLLIHVSALLISNNASSSWQHLAQLGVLCRRDHGLLAFIDPAIATWETCKAERMFEGCDVTSECTNKSFN